MTFEDDDTPAEEEAEGWEPRLETCRIVLWRGYVTSAFTARTTHDHRGVVVAQPSASFRSRSATAPDTPETRSAHADVVSRLEADGWVQAGQGAAWYETEFARTVLVPVRAPEAAPEGAQPEPLPAVALEPAPVAAVAAPPPRPAPEPEPAPVARVARPSRRGAGWRLAAATGLVAALGLLGWFATHPSPLRGSAPSRPGSAAVPSRS